MKKRGQITGFIILAIIIITSVLSVFLIRNYVLKTAIEREFEKAALLPQQVKPVQSYLSSCLTQLSSDAAAIVGIQGGFITIPEYRLPTTPLNPFSNKLDIVDGLSVPYCFYETSTVIQKIPQPSIKEIESQLSTYINNNFNGCLTNLTAFTQDGYNFTALYSPNTTVIIKDKSVLVEVDYPLTINLKDFNFILKKHVAIIDVPLGNLYKVANNIFKKVNENNFFEEKTLDILTAYEEIPFSGTSFDCKEKIWSKKETIEKLKNIISSNIGATVLKGTPYTLLDPTHKYFILDAGNTRNLNANFMYSQSWPISVEISPSDGDLLMGDFITRKIGELSTLTASIFCLNTYHFIYSIKYPILVTLRDDNGYVFQFSTQAIIKNNQPKEAVIQPEVYETQPILCENPVTETTVYALNPDESGVLKPLYDASVSFKCFNVNCPIGKADLDESGESSLTKKFPACLNGQIIAEKDGYYKATTTISTNYPSVISLILEPYYTKKIKVKAIEKDTGIIRDLYDTEQVVLELKNKDNDYYVSYAHPSEEQEIKLIAGNYNAKAYVIENSSFPIKIQGESIKKCVSVPAPNILGIFIKNERCFDTSIPEITLDQVIKGGVVFDFDITRNMLVDKNELIIYVMVDKTPSTYTTLSQVYESIEQNSNNKYFRYPQ